MTISGAAEQLGDTRHVGRAEVELGLVAGEERRVTAAFFLGQDVHLSGELRVRGDALGSTQHLATLEVSFSMPRNSTPTFSPA